MLKAYKEYRDTKIPWLKSLPKNWTFLKIGELFEERKTKVSDKEYTSLIQEYRTRFISDVVTGKVNVQNVMVPNYTPEILNDELENGILEENLNDQ